ncbi:MAG: hypothetical protein Q8R00_01220 [Candidatus Nanoarchaeia archaeon]|nr:hypothetical protein [Candidatus Nanoarchaeia archaeon]
MVMWPFKEKKKQTHFSVIFVMIGAFLMIYKESIQIAGFIDTFTLGLILTAISMMYFFDVQ